MANQEAKLKRKVADKKVTNVHPLFYKYTTEDENAEGRFESDSDKVVLNHINTYLGEVCNNGGVDEYSMAIYKLDRVITMRNKQEVTVLPIK